MLLRLLGSLAQPSMTLATAELLDQQQRTQNLQEPWVLQSSILVQLCRLVLRAYRLRRQSCSTRNPCWSCCRLSDLTLYPARTHDKL